jgi:hypothetical protein
MTRRLGPFCQGRRKKTPKDFGILCDKNSVCVTEHSFLILNRVRQSSVLSVPPPAKINSSRLEGISTRRPG